jgi:hypothetical protein
MHRLLIVMLLVLSGCHLFKPTADASAPIPSHPLNSSGPLLYTAHAAWTGLQADAPTHAILELYNPGTHTVQVVLSRSDSGSGLMRQPASRLVVEQERLILIAHRSEPRATWRYPPCAIRVSPESTNTTCAPSTPRNLPASFP